MWEVGEGSGAGVGQRENGFEEGVSVAKRAIEAEVAVVLVLLWVADDNALASDAVVDVDAVESEESWRLLLRWEEWRRKEREGRR